VQLASSIAYSQGRLRCDRQIPCAPCSKRGNGDSCTYASSTRNGHDELSRTSEAQLRLNKLEKMITHIMNNTADGSESLTDRSTPHSLNVEEHLRDLSVHNSPQSSSVSSGGRLDISGSEANYLGATHWTTILENVGGSSKSGYYCC